MNWHPVPFPSFPLPPFLGHPVLAPGRHRGARTGCPRNGTRAVLPTRMVMGRQDWHPVHCPSSPFFLPAPSFPSLHSLLPPSASSPSFPSLPFPSFHSFPFPSFHSFPSLPSFHSFHSFLPSFPSFLPILPFHSLPFRSFPS